MNTKTCGRCRREKSVDEFHRQSKTHDGRQTVCKLCKRVIDCERYSEDSRKRQKNDEYRDRIRQAITEYKLSAGGCKYCDEKEPVALDLHHPETDKEFNVSQWQKLGKGFEAVVMEMKKCDVVCSNCHRKLHAGLIAR